MCGNACSYHQAAPAAVAAVAAASLTFAMLLLSLLLLHLQSMHTTPHITPLHSYVPHHSRSHRSPDSTKARTMTHCICLTAAGIGSPAKRPTLHEPEFDPMDACDAGTDTEDKDTPAKKVKRKKRAPGCAPGEEKKPTQTAKASAKPVSKKAKEGPGSPPAKKGGGVNARTLGTPQKLHASGASSIIQSQQAGGTTAVPKPPAAKNSIQSFFAPRVKSQPVLITPLPPLTALP